MRRAILVAALALGCADRNGGELAMENTQGTWREARD